MHNAKDQDSLGELLGELRQDIGLAEAKAPAGTVAITMSGPLYSELGFLEVDTGGDGSWGAKGFIDAWRKAKRAGKSYKLFVNQDGYKHMLDPHGPLRQHQDIWDDSDEPKAKLALRAARALYKKLSQNPNPFTEDTELWEARQVKRSKSKAIVATMDAIKAEMTAAGWKHRQMGSVDTYTRKVDAEQAAKAVAAALKKHNLKGFHNREEDEYTVKWYFEHPRHRGFLATLTHYKDEPGEVYLHVQDQAMVR